MQVLGEFTPFADRIIEHRNESRRLDEERTAMRIEWDRAARTLDARRDEIRIREREAFEAMSEERKIEWRWEETIFAWLTGDPNA